MLDTAEEFLLSSLNISETCRKLYMHRNTLLYRLDKIQEATGLDIRTFSDAMLFKTIAVLYKMHGMTKTA
jgi:carbohydrate diacid regulator